VCANVYYVFLLDIEDEDQRVIELLTTRTQTVRCRSGREGGGEGGREGGGDQKSTKHRLDSLGGTQRTKLYRTHGNTLKRLTCKTDFFSFAFFVFFVRCWCGAGRADGGRGRGGESQFKTCFPPRRRYFFLAADLLLPFCHTIDVGQRMPEAWYGHSVAHGACS